MLFICKNELIKKCALCLTVSQVTVLEALVALGVFKKELKFACLKGYLKL